MVVQAPPGLVASRDLPHKVARVKGVGATTAVDHSYAYVGPDLQDTYGIDARTIGKATTLRDSYFIGGTAGSNMARLRAHPDGVLVSKETISDYSLKIGDLLKLRVLDHRTGKFHVVPFHVAGIVQEFPSAPRDSFMVANVGYLQAADHTGTIASDRSKHLSSARCRRGWTSSGPLWSRRRSPRGRVRRTARCAQPCAQGRIPRPAHEEARTHFHQHFPPGARGGTRTPKPFGAGT